MIKSGPNYSFNDILNITSIEKRKIPVYNTATYKDGIYHTFDRFKNIEPSSSQFELTRNKKGKITKLERIWNSGASRAEVKPSDIFCVVQNGKIYMASDYGFAPAEFKNDDFYFQGKAKVTAKTGNVILATAFFGIIGGIIAGDATSEFEMKVDHLNGSTVLIKQINK